MRVNRDKIKRAGMHTDWLELSDLWSKAGYAQPVVHHDWITWQAAFKAQKAINDRKGKV